MQVLSFDVGIRNLAFAVVDTTPAGEVQDIRHWEVVDIVKDNGSRAKNARNIPLQRIVGFLCKSLDRRRHLFDRVQSVAVEQQPAGRGPVSNIKCKVLSHAIQMWALRSGMEDVQFINPKKKTPASAPTRTANRQPSTRSRKCFRPSGSRRGSRGSTRSRRRTTPRTACSSSPRGKCRPDRAQSPSRAPQILLEM